MAHLFTSHDKYHVHKTLGFLALLDYLYRIILLVRFGTAFPDFESVWFSSACVFLHGLLSWSSLLLPLPATRNLSSPMIWPEFRLHSITFATRHVIATIMTLLGLWPNNLWAHALARGIILLGTIQAASIITDKWGDREQRTTNSMVYPSIISTQQQLQIKKGYSRAQFSATLACLLPDATQSFAPLLAIQMAPFLMTLVRKGKINSLAYHRGYALSLMIGYTMVLYRMTQDSQVAVVASAILSLPTPTLRKYMSAMKLAALQVVFAMIVCPLVMFPALEQYIPMEGHNELVICRLMWIGTIVTTARQLEEYMPLFWQSSSSQQQPSSSSQDEEALPTPPVSSSKSPIVRSICNALEILIPAAGLVYSLAPSLAALGGLEETLLQD